MPTHLSVLPTDILQTVALRLEAHQIPSPVKPNDDISYLTLPHPRTGVPALFFPTESKILEIQSVDPPDKRSWFMEDQIISDGKLVIMTPIDPAFLLLPVLLAAKLEDVFRTADDIFEEAIKNLDSHNLQTSSSDQFTPQSVQAKSIIHFSSLSCVRQAFKRFCETKELSPDTVVYRYSPAKVVDYLRFKVARLALPQVMDGCRTILRGLAKDGLMEDGKDGLLKLGRIKASCDLVSQYLPLEIRILLLATYDFSELEKYLLDNEEQRSCLAPPASTAAKIKAESNASEKKRKAPVKTSHGVEQLKKVNVNGMAKLSSFFNKTEKIR